MLSIGLPFLAASAIGEALHLKAAASQALGQDISHHCSYRCDC